MDEPDLLANPLTEFPTPPTPKDATLLVMSCHRVVEYKHKNAFPPPAGSLIMLQHNPLMTGAVTVSSNHARNPLSDHALSPPPPAAIDFLFCSIGGQQDAASRTKAVQGRCA